MNINERVLKLIERVESYNFECEGGYLKNCLDWIELRTIITAVFDHENQPNQYGLKPQAWVDLAILQQACGQLLDYRKRNGVNFQLEKADDYLKAIEKLIIGGDHAD